MEPNAFKSNFPTDSIIQITGSINQINESLTFKPKEKDALYTRINQILDTLKYVPLRDGLNQELLRSMQVLSKRLSDAEGTPKELLTKIDALMKKDLRFEMLPPDIMRSIPLTPAELRNTKVVSKKLKKSSEDSMINWINKNKKPLDELGLTKHGLESLLKNHGAELKYFEMSGCSQDDVLKFIDYCPNINQLLIRNCTIDTIGAQTLANKEHLKGLTTLDLSNNQIGAAGAKDLANSAHLTGLITLNLSFNRIGDAGAKDIANSTHLTSLTTLNLRFNQIGDAGATDFANSAHLTSLKKLMLWLKPTSNPQPKKNCD